MKYFAQALCLLAIAFSPLASAYQNNSLYISADAGIFQADFNNTFLDQTDIIPQNIAQTAEQHGYTGGIALGYSHLFNQTYLLGAELSGNLDGQYAAYQSGASSLAFSDMAQIKSHVDLTFVPGIMLNPTIAAYLKLGLSFAALQDNLNSPDGYTPTNSSVSNNKNALGLAAGLGFKKWVTEHTVIFTEADYHDYGTVNFANFQNFTASYSHSAHIYSYDVVIGASYQFDV